MQNTLFHYWGKADEKYVGATTWHPLTYHSLDVSAVALAWWDASQTIQRMFLTSFNCYESQHLRAWVTFFVALHDLGKFDVRFQLKAPSALAAAWRALGSKDHGLSKKEVAGFDHGWAGMAWANQEYRQWVRRDDTDYGIWERWQPWLAAVTGHHGDFFTASMPGLPLDTDQLIVEHDRAARSEFVSALSRLFLEPVGLSVQDVPPTCSLSAQYWLAGYCSACDWMGSNVEVFDYQYPNTPLTDYLEARIIKIQDEDRLSRFGLLGKARAYKGLSALLKANESPRGIQVEIDRLPATSGLTLIEAPTGSGKTEAALAYAWRLLDQGVADSIVFALPTQATANAMLARVEAFAERAFGSANIVLAHGKREFNEAFQRLVASGQRATAQGKIEAAVQCATWLASSRKRVFLGQIGVCTIDQVLLSVLPVRHKFVRGFGINKAVLIVDEVHAYDAYMHGLLGEVLRRQKSTGGTVILLSATLPANVRGKLLKSWESTGPDHAPYPAIWHATQGQATCITLPDHQRPPKCEVEVKCLKLPGAFPDDAVIGQIIAAGESGALVAVVMNLVDDAQRLARLLRDRTTLPVDVFHARYRFTDRQDKERRVLDNYGRMASRESGRILVATQVVEQSLDLDFDWMLTQICPVDLLFQRLGRLHRHERPRPAGFELPHCSVLSVKSDDYGPHKLIYGNARVLWRTERLLVAAGRIVFPEAYRDWLEQVYAETSGDDEPDVIYGDYLSWKQNQQMREAQAKQLTTMTVSQFRDEDSEVTGLTRDSEMSLTVLPMQADGRLLDGQVLKALTERDLAETLNFQAIPVPASWKGRLSACRLESEGDLAGYRPLEMTAVGQGAWLATDGKFQYSVDLGLEKNSDGSA